MPLSLFTRKNRIINLIINDHSIRFVELKQLNPPIIQRWGERIIPSGIIRDGKIMDPETLGTILEECVNDWKIKKRQVRFIVPDSFVIIRKVSIPADVKNDEIKGYLYLELGTSIHLPFDEPVFDTVILSEETKTSELLIFAAQEENVMEYAKILTETKLIPEAADISPLALYRLYYQLDMPAEDERLLMVQFELNMVNICIFENHLPFSIHHLVIDFDQETRDIRLNPSGNYEITYIDEMNKLHLQFEDIYKEINRLMDFYRYSIHQGKQQVTNMLVNGDHPMLDTIAKEMKNRFEVPIQTLDGNSIATATGDNLPRTHYLALGLALKEV